MSRKRNIGCIHTGHIITEWFYKYESKTKNIETPNEERMLYHPFSAAPECGQTLSNIDRVRQGIQSCVIKPATRSKNITNSTCLQHIVMTCKHLRIDGYLADVSLHHFPYIYSRLSRFEFSLSVDNSVCKLHWKHV